MPIAKVLVANRGEIAVRIIRGAADAGLRTVAIYADQDIDALFVTMADEAFALGGATATQTYLDIDKILAIASRSGADAVHPGYGFLAENGDAAQAVIDAGLTWVGPSPAAIKLLGDKVTARALARTVGAPLAPGSPGPIADADEAVAFATEYGMPIAIKAAYGGGGRGLKVARTIEEIPAQFEAATREAVAAFGRGECFVERYLDKPRHVETQCLADQHGHVVVVSTRDCTVQRRHQKLIEEAPAPFLTQAQRDQMTEASMAILSAAGYVGAGTVEFLIGTDGTLSFLEVNTRLQVEHPVTEQVTGIDLVGAMFSIADGASVADLEPTPRGHAMEFRINAEDPGRNFLPAPGTLTTWMPPSGPGVRVDEGYHQGMAVPAAFDSLIAKVIVTGADRQQTLARSRRALRELRVGGMPTVVPFHLAVVNDPAFTAVDGDFAVFTDWVETEFDNQIAPYPHSPEHADADPRDEIVVEVEGRRLTVTMPTSVASPGRVSAGTRPTAPRRRTEAPSGALGDEVTAPMQGTIVAALVADGDVVAVGDPLVVMEAMKMEQPVSAHRSGTVVGLVAEPGATVAAGTVLCRIQGR